MQLRPASIPTTAVGVESVRALTEQLRRGGRAVGERSFGPVLAEASGLVPTRPSRSPHLARVETQERFGNRARARKKVEEIAGHQQYAASRAVEQTSDSQLKEGGLVAEDLISGKHQGH